jgi:hypothetical protein
VSLIEKALEVAGEGYPVFPCTRKKRPCWSNDELGVEAGEGGLKIAARDPEEIKRLFAHPGAALIGVPTGSASGLAVVDIDVKDGKCGQDWYDDHLAELGLTRWHKTQSGGVHLVYAINGVDPGSNAGVIHDGVDLRGGGGYIIWWPAHGCEYGDVELAPFPDWLAQETEEQAEAWATLADDDLEQHIVEAESFHQPMVSLAWRMANDGYSQGHIVEHLAETFDKSIAAKPSHPRHKDWTRRKLDIYRTVSSALEKAGRAELPQQSMPTPAETPRGETPAVAKAVMSLPSFAEAPGRRFDGQEVPEPKFVIEDLVPCGRLCNVAGLGGAGKSILLQLAATCIAEGLPFLGKTTLQGAAAYVTGEDDENTLHHRQARINDLLGLNETPAGLFLASYLGHDLKMFDGKRWTKTFDWLWQEAARIEGLIALMVDPASEVYLGDYSNPVLVKEFNRTFDIKAVEHNLAIFLSMHTAKGGESQKTPFGSAQWLFAARTTLVLEPVIGEDGKPSRDHVTLRVAKGNFIRPGEEIPLVWTDDGLLVRDEGPAPAEQLARLKELDTLIFMHADEAWKARDPLSDNRSMKDRYLPTVIRDASKGRFSQKEIHQQMKDHIRQGRLSIERHWHNRRLGLKVV